MAITTVFCCLCGGKVIGDGGDPPWMTRFYAVYCLETDRTTWRLSGPGRRLFLHDRVKVGDEATGSTESTEESLIIRLSPVRLGPIPPAQYDPPEEVPTARGHPFHVACWRLFSACGGPIEPSYMQRVANLCRSTPTRYGRVSWSHNYGDPVDVRARARGAVTDAYTSPAPGEELLILDFPSMSLRRGLGPDPWDIPELAHVFSFSGAPETPETPEALEMTVASQRTIRPVGAGPMGAAEKSALEMLPVEMLTMILTHLPSADVARLRLASRGFASMPLPDHFWRSRFWPGREFDHIVEAHHPPPSCRGSWKRIFDAVRALHTVEAMAERRRIWHLGHVLRGVLRAMGDVECAGTPVRSFLKPHVLTESSPAGWVTASRALRGYSGRLDDSFPMGSICHAERELRVPLPDQITAVFASTIDLFGQRYVSGIRIVRSDNGASSLGYVRPESEALVSQVDAQRPLTGFCLAQDQRGVRGLAMVFADDSTSRWVGDHEQVPKRRLLTQNEGRKPVDALIGGFDATKLVFLAVSWAQELGEQQQQQGNPERRSPPLRNTILWYPDIPDKSLCFLDTSGRIIQPHRELELPLCYNLFGGLRGDHLDNVSGITVRKGKGINDRVLDITVDFVHSEPAAHFGSHSVQASTAWSFAVEGHRGERITGVDVFRSLTGLRVYTSFGRIANFPPTLSERPAGDAYRSTRIDTEDTMVGFWGRMNTIHGLYDLGLVTIKSPRSPGALDLQG